ncbi:MAG TPA: BON domain-containing protein [Planctomycetaceae bacterium]|nr:BON domain-containing protein [Planctomycetaceae bacterium]
MRIQGMLLAGALALCGCDRPAVTPTTTGSPPKDNTAINERDQSPVAKTPIDQDENTADVAITADIRKQVVAQPNFSVNAQNVKIITSQGKVTLRGPVATQQEIDAIAKIAEQVAGATNVDNQLELAP